MATVVVCDGHCGLDAVLARPQWSLETATVVVSNGHCGRDALQARPQWSLVTATKPTSFQENWKNIQLKLICKKCEKMK